MATQMKGTLKRTIRLYSVHSPVIVTLSEEGVQMQVPGNKKKIMASWETVARNCSTPMDVPSFLAGKPVEFLQWQVQKKEAKKGVDSGQTA